MSYDEKRLRELMDKLRKVKGLCPLSEEEAEAAYNAAPDEPMTEDEIRSVVETVTSGELASWEPRLDLDWSEEVDLEDVASDAYQLFRNKGEGDAESAAAEEELRREMLDDGDDENGPAGGTTPPATGL